MGCPGPLLESLGEEDRREFGELGVGGGSKLDRRVRDIARFQRVCLDHAFGRCWYDALDRKKGPAIRQIATDALERAVACARRLEADESPDADAVRALDDQSLLWRGKKPKAARRAS